MNVGLLVIYLLAVIALLFAARNKTFLSTFVGVILQLVLIWWALGWRLDPFVR